MGSQLIHRLAFSSTLSVSAVALLSSSEVFILASSEILSSVFLFLCCYSGKEN